METEKQSRREGLYRLLHATLLELELDSDLLLARQDLDVEAVETLSVCALSDAVNRVWEDALSMSDDLAVGLRIPAGAAYALGPVTPMVACAETVREALQAITRFAGMISSTITVRLMAEKDRYYIELMLAPGTHKALAPRYDFAAQVLIQHVRALTGCSFRLAEYHRPGTRPRDSSQWEGHFGCEVKFNASRCMIVLPREEVEVSIAGADPAVTEFCGQLLRRQHQGAQSDFSSRVRRTLERLISTGELRREDVAGKLGISPRSLSRRLAQEGTGFAQLVNDVRRDLALQYLRNREFKFNEITLALGFVDPSNFYRACKRWFGHPPQRLREEAAIDAGCADPCKRATLSDLPASGRSEAGMKTG